MAHFVLTLLHLVQMTLAYFLMLIVMTYNSWLCGAVILGNPIFFFPKKEYYYFLPTPKNTINQKSNKLDYTYKQEIIIIIIIIKY